MSADESSTQDGVPGHSRAFGVPFAMAMASLLIVPETRGEDVTVREIIERHPRPVSLDRELLLRCIDDCFDCAATCTACADACLGEPGVPELVRCVRLNLDCADICEVGRAA